MRVWRERAWREQQAAAVVSDMSSAGRPPNWRRSPGPAPNACRPRQQHRPSVDALTRPSSGSGRRRSIVVPSPEQKALSPFDGETANSSAGPAGSSMKSIRQPQPASSAPSTAHSALKMNITFVRLRWCRTVKVVPPAASPLKSTIVGRAAEHRRRRPVVCASRISARVGWRPTVRRPDHDQAEGGGRQCSRPHVPASSGKELNSVRHHLAGGQSPVVNAGRWRNRFTATATIAAGSGDRLNSDSEFS